LTVDVKKRIECGKCKAHKKTTSAAATGCFVFFGYGANKRLLAVKTHFGVVIFVQKKGASPQPT
jgi:hypothetical protein